MPILSGFPVGSAELNFSVVAYASEDAFPNTASENTIAIITSTPITEYSFSVDAPAVQSEGCVWISTGIKSEQAFNALTGNTIMVYPLEAKQYINGSWTSVGVKSYQGGEWMSWWEGELYSYGNEYTNKTGGWTTDGFSYADSIMAPAYFTKNADHLVVGPSPGGVCVAACANAIDLTEYKTLTIKYKNTAVTGVGLVFDVSTTKNMRTDRVAVLDATSAVDVVATISLSVESLTGKHYIGAHASGSQGGVIYEMKLS